MLASPLILDTPLAQSLPLQLQVAPRLVADLAQRKGPALFVVLPATHIASLPLYLPNKLREVSASPEAESRHLRYVLLMVRDNAGPQLLEAQLVCLRQGYRLLPCLSTEQAKQAVLGLMAR